MLRARIGEVETLTELSDAGAQSAELLAKRSSKHGDQILVSSDWLKKICGSKETWQSVIEALHQDDHLIGSPGAATRQVSVGRRRRRFVCLKSSFGTGGNR
jgi:hypothetical protein